MTWDKNDWNGKKSGNTSSAILRTMEKFALEFYYKNIFTIWLATSLHFQFMV